MKKILVFLVAMLPVAGSFAQTQWESRSESFVAKLYYKAFGD